MNIEYDPILHYVVACIVGVLTVYMAYRVLKDSEKAIEEDKEFLARNHPQWLNSASAEFRPLKIFFLLLHD